GDLARDYPLEYIIRRLEAKAAHPVAQSIEEADDAIEEAINALAIGGASGPVLGKAGDEFLIKEFPLCRTVLGVGLNISVPERPAIAHVDGFHLLLDADLPCAIQQDLP